MRILSQNGVHDLNYDNVNLEIHGGTITAHDAARTAFLLARYSTPERAQDEMLRLHAKYLVTKAVSGKTGITIHEDLPKIFKFEADEVTEWKKLDQLKDAFAISTVSTRSITAATAGIWSR